MSATLINKAFAHPPSTGAVPSITTSGIDTSGADFLLICVAQYFGYTITPSDSEGNTWQSLTKYGQSGGYVQMFYCYNPNVGAGHTFTASFGTNDYGTIFAYAFSGMDTTSSVFDAENGAAAYATGTITPSESGELLVSTYQQYAYASEITEDPAGGWSIEDSDPYAGGYTPGGTVAFINTYGSTTAIECDWDLTQQTGQGKASCIAAFKLASGGGTTYQRAVLGSFGAQGTILRSSSVKRTAVGVLVPSTNLLKRATELTRKILGSI